MWDEGKVVVWSNDESTHHKEQFSTSDDQK